MGVAGNMAGILQSKGGGTRAAKTAEPESYTTSSLTVAEVQADVEDGKVTAAEALAAESSLSNPRSTLVTWLEQYDSEG
jgi:hypothetical protein